MSFLSETFSIFYHYISTMDLKALHLSLQLTVTIFNVPSSIPSHKDIAVERTDVP